MLPLGDALDARYVCFAFETGFSFPLAVCMVRMQAEGYDKSPDELCVDINKNCSKRSNCGVCINLRAFAAAAAEQQQQQQQPAQLPLKKKQTP